MRRVSRGGRSVASAKTPAWVASRGLAGVELAGWKAAELVARSDVELLEDLAQVVLHRAGADEQLCADLRVGETILGEPSDVCLLWCEDAARVVGARPCGLTRRRELVTGALGKSVGPDAAEHFVGCSELLARVDAPVLATQPFAVQEPGAGEVDNATGACQPLDRLAVVRLCVASLAEQRA